MGSTRRRRIWWATWPGALAMGLVGAVLGFPGFVAGLAALIVPDHDSSGLDFQVEQAPSYLPVLGAVQLLCFVAFPVLTVVWCRRRWAGYVLLGLGLSAVLGIVGLVQWGIL